MRSDKKTFEAEEISSLDGFSSICSYLLNPSDLDKNSAAALEAFSFSAILAASASVVCIFCRFAAISEACAFDT